MRDPKIEHADGKLRGVTYNYSKILENNDRLIEIAHELYDVASPAIKSTEEAKYQSGTRCYQSNVTSLMYEEEMLGKELDKHCEELNEVGRRLERLNPIEVNIISGYYEFHYTIQALAGMYYMSKSQMYRLINEILMKY